MLVDRSLSIFWSISLFTFIWGGKNKDDILGNAIRFGLGDELFLCIE